MTGPSSSPRPEHTPRPGTHWETRLTRTEQVIPDDAPDPAPPNRKTRRAMQRSTEDPMTDQITALENRLRLASQACRAKTAQLDDIKRAMLDTGLINDGDPYSHADLADVIRQAIAADRERMRQVDEKADQQLDDIADAAKKFKAWGEEQRARAEQAEEAARRALDQRQEMAAERYAWQERGDRAEAELRRVRDTNQKLVTERADTEEGITAAIRRAKHEEQRALRVEAAIARVQQALHDLPYEHARTILTALDQPKEQ